MKLRNIDNLKEADLKILFSGYRSEILKLIASDQIHKPGFKDLQKSFIDSNGKQHYNYPESVALPMSRLSKLLEYTMWLNAGLTGEELSKLLDMADEAIIEGLKTNKNASKIGFALTEIRNRRGMVVHHELLCNYIAVQNVREDEEPSVFSNEIQLEKVEQIKKEIELGNSYFFFQAPESKKLINSLHITEVELMKYYEESQVKAEALNEIVSRLRSPKE